ncbi:MAG: hypothetical protein HY260_10740 [Chloroflexi bacterium]|nr:hypothetical protein [Chloroflexota bacterium]
MVRVNRFRCYAYRDGEHWYADCLDLMLLVKRDTLPAAMQELELLILDHVQAARGGEGLPVPRPVKFGDWLGYYWRTLGHSLRVLLLGRADGLVAYEVQVPKGDSKVVYA